jgi:hypothetical protein
MCKQSKPITLIGPSRAAICRSNFNPNSTGNTDFSSDCPTIECAVNLSKMANGEWKTLQVWFKSDQIYLRSYWNITVLLPPLSDIVILIHFMPCLPWQKGDRWVKIHFSWAGNSHPSVKICIHLQCIVLCHVECTDCMDTMMMMHAVLDAVSHAVSHARSEVYEGRPALSDCSWFSLL